MVLLNYKQDITVYCVVMARMNGILFHIGFECYNRKQVYTLKCPVHNANGSVL